MNPQTQLQPVNPRPQVDFAEPTRQLQIKPGPRPLDFRPRPKPTSAAGGLVGPPTPQEVARLRSSPLGNPLNVAKPVFDNPIGYAPGKGLVSLAAPILERATDPSTFGVPVEEFKESGAGALEFPSFNPDAFLGGVVIAPEVLPPFTGGQMAVPYIVTASHSYTNPRTGEVITAGGTAQLTGPIAAVRLQNTGSVVFVAEVGGEVRRETYRLRIVVAFAGGTSFHVLGFSAETTSYLCDVVNGVAVNCTGQRETIGEIGSPSMVTVNRADGQPDTGGNIPGGAPAVLAPNPARVAIPVARQLPQRRPRTPFKTPPVPSLPLPQFRLPEFPEIAPTETPAIDPDVPVLPLREPFKFPAPVTIPDLPGGDINAPDAPTKRPPPVQFPPSLPGTTGREIAPPDLPRIPPIFIPPLRRDDCATSSDLVRESSRIRDLIEDILDKLLNDCKDLCSDAQLTRAFCEVVDGQLVARQEFQTYQALAPALGFLSREIAEIKAAAAPCTQANPESVPPIVLASGSMIEGNTVAYVDILPEVRQVELIITGQIPNSLRLYDSTLTGEQQGKFGAITLAYPGVTGGNAPDAFHQWAWTRRTSFYVGPPIRNDRRIRINLKPLLTWVLYDTGLRS